MWVWGTYDGRNDWNNHAKVVVRISFNDAGGYLIVLKATDCTDYEYVESRREKDGENERQTITCAFQHQSQYCENE